MYYVARNWLLDKSSVRCCGYSLDAFTLLLGASGIKMLLPSPKWFSYGLAPHPYDHFKSTFISSNAAVR